METHSDSACRSAQKSNRRTLILTCCVFLLPVALASILHVTGWYASAGTSNKGTLISPPIPFEAVLKAGHSSAAFIAENHDKAWWILYIMPQQCDSACRNSLFQMRQVQAALGPEKHRVNALLIATAHLTPEYESLLSTEFPTLPVLQADPNKLTQTFKTHNRTLSSPDGKLYLVDTMGAIFMHYPTYIDEKKSVLKGRDILKDLQRVLKLSKIG